MDLSRVERRGRLHMAVCKRSERGCVLKYKVACKPLHACGRKKTKKKRIQVVSEQVSADMR